MNLTKIRGIILILFILFLAFIVRIYGLTFESIWLDEGQSIYYASKPLIDIFNLDEPNPPLYIIILSFFVRIFGISEFWVRLPSVIFGGLSVLLMYFLAKKIFNERIGLIASLILAFSAYNIYYSQEARMYSLLVFLSLLSMYFFINYLQNDNMNNSIYFLISTILLLYSHYFSMLIVLVQNIFLIILFRKKYGRLKRWLAVQSLIFIAYLPALINLINNINNYITRFIWVNGIGDIKFINWNFSGGFVLSILFPLLLLYSFYYFINNLKVISSRNKQMFILLVFWMFIPVIITVVYSLIFKPVFMMRYIIFCSTPLYILIAFSIDKLNKYLRIMTLAAIIIFSLFYITNQIKIIDKESWRDISLYVKSMVQKDDVIIIEPGYYIFPFTYYYLPKCFNNSDLYNCTANEKIYTIWNNLKKERNYTNYANHIIYIRREVSDDENENSFLKYIMANLNTQSKKVFPTPDNGTINLYLLKA